MQKCEFALISYCVLGRCLTFQTQMQDGQVKWKTSKCFIRWQSCLELMEKQLNSSGIVPKVLQHCKFFRRSRTTCRRRTSNPSTFTDRSIFMSMFNDIEWAKRNIDETCISNSEKVKRFSRGHWAFVGLGDEKKRY